MILRYFAARLRRCVWQTAAGAVTLFVAVLCLIFAAALPSALNTAVANYSRQLCGDADLVLTNADDMSDRFFSLAPLRSDPELTSNSVYINGFFKSFAQIKPSDAENSEYCTLYAADYKAQNEYNPIETGLITDFTEDCVIVGADYAARAGLEEGARISLTFGGKSLQFYVAGIAAGEGIFYTGNAVFVSSRALSRFNSLFGSTIVTHCFIKAKDTAALSAINGRLAEDYARLSVLSPEEYSGFSAALSGITVPAVCVATIATAFCLLSLIILLRLVFARDRENFALLRTLGMPEGRIALVTALTGLVMCAISLTVAFFAAGALSQIAWSASLLLRGFRIGAVPYAIGIGGGLAAGMLCAVLSGREYKKRRQKPKVLNRTYIFAAFSAICAAAGILLLRPLPSPAFALLLASLAGFIFILPGAVSPLFSALCRLKANIYTLRLKTLAKSRDWQRFVSFIIAGMLVLLTVSISTATIHVFNKPADYPFDITVAGVRNPSDAFYESVSGAEGVAAAVKCELHLNAKTTYSGLSMHGGSLIALDAKGFGYFGTDFGLTAVGGGKGAVIGSTFASQKALRTGDRFTFIRGKDNFEFTVAGILDSAYGNGYLILVDLAAVASPSRPYSDVLIKADAPVSGVVSKIGSVAGAGAEIIDLKEAQTFLSRLYSDFIRLFDLLCGLIACLTAITMTFMILMRRAAAGTETRQLVPLGLTRSANLRHNLFSVFLALLPVFAFLPFLIFLICKSSLVLFGLFGLRTEMLISLPAVLIISAAGLAYLTAAEGIICARSRPASR